MSDIISDATGMVKRLHRMLRAQEAEQVRQVDQAAVAAVVPAAMVSFGLSYLCSMSVNYCIATFFMPGHPVCSLFVLVLLA